MPVCLTIIDHRRSLIPHPVGDTLRSLATHGGRIIQSRLAGEGVGACRIRNDASQAGSIGSAHELAADRHGGIIEFIFRENRRA